MALGRQLHPRELAILFGHRKTSFDNCTPAGVTKLLGNSMHLAEVWAPILPFYQMSSGFIWDEMLKLMLLRSGPLCLLPSWLRWACSTEMSKTNDMAAILEFLLKECSYSMREWPWFSNQSLLWYLPGIRTPFSGGASLWCNHGHVRPGPEKILIPLSCFAHVEIELYCHDLFIKIQHDDKSHFNLAWTCISLESYFSWCSWSWEGVQVIMLCHILCTSEPGFGRGSFFFQLGWCASDMMCHILCTPEPGFGRGSFFSKWDDVQVIWRCVISFVHRNLGSDEGHFFFKWDDVQVIWRCVISFVHRNLGSDEGHFL